MLKPLAWMATLIMTAGLSACAAEDSTEQTGAGETRCPDKRPQICTREYRPVCARLGDGSRHTYSNGCEACADAQVLAYTAGDCAQQ